MTMAETTASTTPPSADEIPPVGSQAWWDWYFQPGGGWERNGGRQQTRIFAETLCMLVPFDRDAQFSLLDVGCALGEAIAVFHRMYPNATLTGMDTSQVSVSRCRKEVGGAATFEQRNIEHITGFYDIIYASNILEHFTDWQVKARLLAKHCARLCVMVPYMELAKGAPLKPDCGTQHQHTFARASFNFLVEERLVDEINLSTVSCPGAWGWTLTGRLAQGLKNCARFVLGRPCFQEPLQLILDIRTRQKRRSTA